jgi:hypothetical protein
MAPLGHKVLIRQTSDIFPIETGGAETRIAHAHSRSRDQLLEAAVTDQVHAFAGEENLGGDPRPRRGAGKTQHVPSAFSRGHADAEASRRDGALLCHADFLK